ncbi:MAG: T9SS type A sorting domain-containing protein [Bacteroidetes bacterium]|nr:T9SS type A sorting domain-containing protein [Bacteroidota bacterium]PHX83069.1 MAG: hypothetical protein CK539_01385 [Flavobacteriales bacterium]
MKIYSFLLAGVLCCTNTVVFAQTQGISSMKEFYGNDAAAICPGSKSVMINKQSRVPSFIVMRPDVNISASVIFDVLRGPLKMQVADGWKLKRSEKDNLGFTHYRYDQTYNNIKVEAGEYLVHERNGRVESVNGMCLDGIALNTSPVLTESAALQVALNFTNAQLYKWEVAADQAALQHIKNNPNATYFPTGELVIVCANNDVFKKEYHLAWKFDVYALKPFARKYVYVDANVGGIVASVDQIHEIDVPATGTSLYSGLLNFTCDNYSNGQYRMRESGRGNGIETYNANLSTNQNNATDFTNNSATWTATANFDNAAYDAHWGAEKTYDYFSLLHGRNGIDNAGMLMVSYVHYDSGLNNAFWDGTSMSYGDGTQTPGGFNPLVSIDVCGHEFAHGVTQFSCGLVYSYESGAMNEAFSDIMGTAIEFYAKPASADFLIGEEICVNANAALRNMQNPNQYNDPDTYLGTHWHTAASDNGGVHINSGVRNKWFYILSMGESGTNDLGNPYNVAGLGVSSAADICFRGHTVYLVASSQFADCRVADIQSAVDLYGACTPEVVATANAWYAVGVGGVYSSTVTASFAADITTSCNLPMTVNFTNNSSNATNAVWDFGDATTSTTYSPSHIYNSAGSFNVSLSVNSTCGTDSIIQSQYIIINPPTAPVGIDQNSCTQNSFNLTGTGTGTLQWYAGQVGGTPLATGNTFTTPVLNTSTTYYLENQISQPPGSVGPLSYNFGSGGNHNSTSIRYLEFTVYTPCTFVSADVNAGTAGNKTFTLWDNAGNQINQYVVNCPVVGAQTISLNIPLLPGSYRIGGTQMNLYRNSSGPTYPYVLNNVVSITGSEAGPSYYYFLYKWAISLPPCTSIRVPVTATVGGLFVSFATMGYDTSCIVDAPFVLTGGLPLGGTYYGPGVSAGIFDPSIAGVGTHTLYYTYVDSLNCLDTVAQTFVVDNCLGINNTFGTTSVSVYPNPANTFITIELQLGKQQVVEINLLNMLGQIVSVSKSNLPNGISNITLSTAVLPRGIYLLQVKTENGFQVRKVELQ